MDRCAGLGISWQWCTIGWNWRSWSICSSNSYSIWSGCGMILGKWGALTCSEVPTWQMGCAKKRGGSDGWMVDCGCMGQLDNSLAQGGEWGQTCGCICIGHAKTLCGSAHWGVTRTWAVWTRPLARHLSGHKREVGQRGIERDRPWDLSGHE